MSGVSLRRLNLERARLEARFLAAWSRTDQLFRIIKDSQMLSQPIVWRHPFIFYVGHLPAFAWNQIGCTILGWKSFNPYFDALFCRGIDPDVDTGECHWHPDIPEEWPSLKQVLDYRDKVRAAVVDSVAIVPRMSSSDVMAQDGRVFEMVLEHEYMHQETLLYMLQQLPLDKKCRPQNGLRYSFQPALPSRPVEISAGAVRMGAKFGDVIFGWDNEFSETTLNVARFAIDSLPVTNGDFLDFVQCGAYADQRYWCAEDWRWQSSTGRSQPNLWSKQNGAWWYRTMFDLVPLSVVASWPVYVSLAEARAYACWLGKRLPTEGEFHRAAFGAPQAQQSRNRWGDTVPTPRHGNLNFVAWSPTPVGSHPAGFSRWGVGELIGNGWEWTDTPFAPFPGFTPYMTAYPEYSADFFDGKHFVLKGGSWETAQELVRPSFRNWYQAHYPYVFAKFRCVSGKDC
jgi:ergothioneine biosynthesis protein EgtB